MSVTSNGTPVIAVGTLTNTPSVTGTFPNGTPVAGHLIVLIVALFGTTGITSLTTPTGYTVGPVVTETATSATRLACFFKTATGSDSAPVVSAVVTGTSGDQGISVTIYDLTDGTGGTPTIDVSGTASGTTTLPAASSSPAVINNVGDFGIVAAAISNGTTAATNTWGTPTNWTASVSQATSLHLQASICTTTNATAMAQGSVAAATITKTRTTANTVSMILAFQSSVGPVLDAMDGPAGIRAIYVPAGQVMASQIPAVTAPVPLIALIALDGPVQARRPRFAKGAVQNEIGTRSGVGPVLSALDGPVRARQPLPPRGTAASRRGTFSGQGPKPKPLAGPVVPAVRPLPPRGHLGLHLPGAVSGLGPRLKALAGPVIARFPLPPRGRIRNLTGTFSGQGPAVPELRQPVRSKKPVAQRTGRAAWNPGNPFVSLVPEQVRRAIRPQPQFPFLHGRAARNAGAFSGQGPAVRPLQGPVQARQPLPPRGRTYARAGTFSQQGVSFPELRQPVTIRHVLPPRGRKTATPVTPLGFVPPTIGPQLYPLHQPVMARQPLPPRGRFIIGARGTRAGTGPAIPELRQPCQARQPLPSRGRVLSGRGLFASTGPAFTQLRRAVRAQPQFPVRTGRAEGNRGIVSFLGPAFTLLRRAVRGQPAFPVRTGRDYQNPGKFSGQGPAPAELRAPVKAKQPLPPRGLVISRAGVTSGEGPAYIELRRPVKAQPVFPVRTGRATSNPGAPSGTGQALYPLHQPVRVVRPAPGRGGQVIEFRGGTPFHSSPLTPQQAPARSHPQALTRTGRRYTSPVRPTGTGPAVAPLRRPVQSRPPLPPAGRNTRQVSPRPVGLPGPPIPPRATPWGDLGRLGYRYPGTIVQTRHFPAPYHRTKFRLGRLKTAWNEGVPKAGAPIG